MSRSGTRRLLVMAACCLLPLAVPAEMVLVREGRNPCPVYHPARSQPLERSASAQLAAYLTRMSGAAFQTDAAPSILPARGIFVGAVTPVLAEGLRPDDFRILVDGQRLHIVGGSPRGTLYGIYALLEEHLGCRWWSRNEEEVPAGNTTLSLPAMDRTVRCPFTMYGVWNNEAQSPENHFLYKARTKASESFTDTYDMTTLLQRYGQEVQQAFPMDKNGVRRANRRHLCYLAPGIAEALAGALAKEVEKRKGNVRDVIYLAGKAGWQGGMCECAACKAVYAEEAWTDAAGRKKPGYPATLLRMLNKTAEILEQDHFGIRVGILIDLASEPPPPRTLPRSNVVLWALREDHCMVHAVSECTDNSGFRANLGRWVEAAPGRVYVWDYGASFETTFINPFPCLNAVANNINWYRQLGVQGVEIQGNYVSTGGDLAVLKNYVWRRLLWNPDLDARALLKEFCEGYYGPAAAEVMAYVETLENSVRKPEMIDATTYSPDQPYLTAEVLAEMRRARERALAAADGKEPYAQRVREATVGVDAAALLKVGPLREEGDKLIRADLGEDTYPRAKELLNEIRGAGAGEWSTGRIFQQSVPTWQGGPLVTLVHGDLEVKVTPALSGRIRQITYKGIPLLYVEHNARTGGYPQLGGSIVNVGAVHYTLVDTPTARMARMTAEAGIGVWSPETKYHVWQTVRVTDVPAIEVLGTVRRASEARMRGATVSTAYLAPADLSNVRVEMMREDGKWELVALVEKGMTRLPQFAGLRLTFLDKKLMVIDGYMDPKVSNGTIQHDVRKGTLTTNVTIVPVEAPAVGEAPFLYRWFEVRPLP